MPSEETSLQEPAVAVSEAPRDDALLACLLLLARTHGETLTADGAVAGLPLQGGRLTPSLFERAAARAGLSSRVVSAPLRDLQPALLPAVVLLQGERACVVLSCSVDGQTLTVAYPELADAPVEVSLEDLQSQYLGSTIYARPKLRFDARTPVVREGRHGHWFWGVIAENHALYRDVLLAAFLANVFALAMPMFTMNVYDRVVPNNAVDTLWVLSIGLALVLVGDLVLRIMRSKFVDLASSRADVKLSAFIMERVLGTRMEQRPASAGSFASNLRAFESVRVFIG